MYLRQFLLLFEQVTLRSQISPFRPPASSRNDRKEEGATTTRRAAISPGSSRDAGGVRRVGLAIHEPVLGQDSEVAQVHPAIVVQVACQRVCAYWYQKERTRHALRIDSRPHEPAGVFDVKCYFQGPAAIGVYTSTEVDHLVEDFCLGARRLKKCDENRCESNHLFHCCLPPQARDTSRCGLARRRTERDGRIAPTPRFELYFAL
jgi:hypothetical protein